MEKIIYNNTENETSYKNLVHEVIFEITQGKKLQTIIDSIKNSKTGWNHSDFDDTRFRQQEQDEFTVNPFEVEEGVLKCGICGHSRTFSYTKQTRSADEPMTTFATCMTCKHKWTYSG